MFYDGFVIQAGPPAVHKVNVLRRVCYPSGSRLTGALWGRHSQVGSLPCAGHLLDDGAGVLRRALWEHMYHVNQNGKCQLDFDSPCRCKPEAEPDCGKLSMGVSLLCPFSPAIRVLCRGNFVCVRLQSGCARAAVEADL